MKKFNIDFISYPLLGLQQKKLVLSWRNDPKYAMYMVNSRPIALEDHLKFCESLNQRSDCFYFLAEKNGSPCGTINFREYTLPSGTSGWLLGLIITSPADHLAPCCFLGTLGFMDFLRARYTISSIMKNNLASFFFNTVELEYTITEETPECFYASRSMEENHRFLEKCRKENKFGINDCSFKFY